MWFLQTRRPHTLSHPRLRLRSSHPPSHRHTTRRRHHHRCDCSHQRQIRPHHSSRYCFGSLVPRPPPAVPHPRWYRRHGRRHRDGSRGDSSHRHHHRQQSVVSPIRPRCSTTRPRDAHPRHHRHRRHAGFRYRSHCRHRSNHRSHLARFHPCPPHKHTGWYHRRWSACPWRSPPAPPPCSRWARLPRPRPL
jgi:hypothetical protein